MATTLALYDERARLLSQSYARKKIVLQKVQPEVVILRIAFEMTQLLTIP